MVKKYEITSDCKTVDNVKVCRVKALRDININEIVKTKEGSLGGFIEKEGNLSQEGEAWVFGDAVVRDNAKISDNAWVSSKAVVRDNAWVKDNAVVRDNAVVSGKAMVGGKAVVKCGTNLSDSVKVSSGKVCASEDIIFDSQDKLDNYLKGYTRLIENLKSD